MVLCFMISGRAIVAASLPLNMNGVEWGTNYYAPGLGGQPSFDGLPYSSSGSNPSSPVWPVAVVDPLSSTTLGADFLRIDTSAVGANLAYFASSDGGSGSDFNWNAEIATTVEVTLAVTSQTGTNSASLLAFGSSNYFIRMDFSTTAVYFGGHVVTGDFSAMTTYRITMADMNTATPTASLYLNNSSEAVATMNGTTPGNFYASGGLNFMQFGDADPGPSMGGVVDWQGIRWLPEMAVAPIPEPSAMVLSGLGLVTLALLARRVRK